MIGAVSRKIRRIPRNERKALYSNRMRLYTIAKSVNWTLGIQDNGNGKRRESQGGGGMVVYKTPASARCKRSTRQTDNDSVRTPPDRPAEHQHQMILDDDPGTTSPDARTE